MANEHGGRRAGDGDHIVMLGVPDAVIAKGLCVLGGAHAFAKTLGNITPVDDAGKIKNREGR